MKRLPTIRREYRKGQLDDLQLWGEDELELEDGYERVSSVVRFVPCSEIFEITIQDDSSLTRCRSPPEDQIYCMIERYLRPRARDAWVTRHNYLVRCHTTPRKGLFMPGTRRLPEGVLLDYIGGDRWTQALFLTPDQENVSHARIIRNDWKLADGDCERLEGWWVGEAKFRMSDDFPIRRSPDHHLQTMHALAKGGLAPRSTCALAILR